MIANTIKQQNEIESQIIEAKPNRSNIRPEINGPKK